MIISPSSCGTAGRAADQQTDAVRGGVTRPFIAGLLITHGETGFGIRAAGLRFSAGFDIARVEVERHIPFSTAPTSVAVPSGKGVTPSSFSN